MQLQIIFALLTLIAVTNSQSSVSINLFATDLNGCGLGGCDAYVKIFCASSMSDWAQCGRTVRKAGDNYPIWPEIFNFTHVNGNNERWRFDVFDQNILFDKLIGSVNVIVDDFVDAVSNMHRAALGTRGYLVVQRRR